MERVFPSGYIKLKFSEIIELNNLRNATSAQPLQTTYLAEVADNMAPLPIVLRQDVEEEGFHVIVERLVVEEELREETQVLAVRLRRMVLCYFIHIIVTIIL